MSPHPTTQEVATYLVEASGLARDKVALIPRSFTNSDNLIALSVRAVGGRPWVLEKDRTICKRLERLGYVDMFWEQDFRDWALVMFDTHKHPDPTQRLKLPVVILDLNCNQFDYQWAWRFVRDGGTLVGITHESVVKQLQTWIKAVDADVENFPVELRVPKDYLLVRASKTIVNMKY